MEMIEILQKSKSYDINISNISCGTTHNGMKISIQGKSIEDSYFLYSRLADYLCEINTPYKVATKRRFDLKGRANEGLRYIEQSHKAMTIYCIDGFPFDKLCEEVYSRIKDYKGWHDIKTPTSYEHYAGGVYFRHAKDEMGNYIPAN